MADEKRKETDEELMERFDAFVRSTLLEEGNSCGRKRVIPLFRRRIWRMWIHCLP